MAQEALLRAYQNLHRYDDSRPFDLWVLAITRNLCLDLLRRLGIHPAPAERAPTLAVPDAARESVRAKLRQAGWQGERYALVHPGSRWMFKAWTPEGNARDDESEPESQSDSTSDPLCSLAFRVVEAVSHPPIIGGRDSGWPVSPDSVSG